jgi:hypothetical protein
MTRVAAGGIIAILLFDLIASIASKRLGFPYQWATIGSFVIYFLIGYIAAKSSGQPVRAAAVVAAIVGLAEASIGWWISWQLEVGRPADGRELTISSWLTAASFVIAVAALLGALGGFVGRRGSDAVATL